MNTPGGHQTPGGRIHPMRKFPSLASVQTAHTVQTMASLGFLAPGYGYVPRKKKLEKPFGPSFKTIMNRTERGPGKKFLTYAYVCFGMSVLCFIGVALYFGHRNVHRMMVYRTEVFGGLMAMAGILFFGAGINLLYKARVESNRWRRFIRFKPEGMFTVAASNPAYVAEESMDLQTGTYGERAITQIPKSKSRGTRWGSQPNLRAARSIERGLDDPKPSTGRRAPPYDQLRNMGRSSPALHNIPEEKLREPIEMVHRMPLRKPLPPPPPPLQHQYRYQPSRPAPLPPPSVPVSYDEAPESEL